MRTFYKRLLVMIAFMVGVSLFVVALVYVVSTGSLWMAGVTVALILAGGGWAIGSAVFPEQESQAEREHPAVEPLMRALALAHDPGTKYAEAHAAIIEAVDALTK